MLPTGSELHQRYRIDGLLGEGGMGRVYKAFDSNLQRVCVVKELNLPLAEMRATGPMKTGPVEQFKQEARTLANLTHPGLPRVIDYFEEARNYYLIMDFVSGRSLEKWVGTRVEESVAIGYAAKLLDVLTYIHSQGVLHRDIKPANIIIRTDQTPVLVDFGLTKSTTDVTRNFARGMGTQEYAPPEQYSGGTDERSDLYSLGATLYHLLGGQQPTNAADRMAGTPLVELRQLRADLSPALSGAIMRVLELNRQNRFQNAGEFKSALTYQGGTVILKPAQLEPAMQLLNQLDQRSQRPSSGKGAIFLLSSVGLALGLVALAFLIQALSSSLTPASPAMPAPTIPPTLATPSTPSTSLSEVPSATAEPSATEMVEPATVVPTAIPNPPASTPTSPPPQPPAQPELVTLSLDNLAEGIEGTLKLPASIERGVPFDIEFEGKNIGANSRGGSITLSFPDNLDVEITEADVRILSPNWSDCDITASHAWVFPTSRCKRMSDIKCKSIASRYPLAETWHKPWSGGERHAFKVRVSPPTSLSVIKIYARIAMLEGASGCKLRISPSTAAEKDQQSYPVVSHTILVK